MVHIYILIDPVTLLVRYVGKTNNLKLRYNLHLSHLKKKSRKINWIKSLKKRGLKPIMSSIDIVPDNDWQFWEMHYISLYKSWGFDLTNGTHGGESGPSLKGVKKSNETKDKIRKFWRENKRVISDNHKDILRKTLKETHRKRKELGIKMSEATREKIRQSKLNMSEEYRQKLSESIRGRKYNDCHKRKLSYAHRNQTNENLMRGVAQFTKDGVFIKEYKGISIAAREVGGNSKYNTGIVASIKKNGTSLGYRWKYVTNTRTNEIINNQNVS